MSLHLIQEDSVVSRIFCDKNILYPILMSMSYDGVLRLARTFREAMIIFNDEIFWRIKALECLGVEIEDFNRTIFPPYLRYCELEALEYSIPSPFTEGPSLFFARKRSTLYPSNLMSVLHDPEVVQLYESYMVGRLGLFKETMKEPIIVGAAVMGLVGGNHMKMMQEIAPRFSDIPESLHWAGSGEMYEYLSNIDPAKEIHDAFFYHSVCNRAISLNNEVLVAYLLPRLQNGPRAFLCKCVFLASKRKDERMIKLIMDNASPTALKDAAWGVMIEEVDKLGVSSNIVHMLVDKAGLKYRWKDSTRKIMEKYGITACNPPRKGRRF